jgi:hypothetical protein
VDWVPIFERNKHDVSLANGSGETFSFRRGPNLFKKAQFRAPIPNGPTRGRFETILSPLTPTSYCGFGVASVEA